MLVSKLMHRKLSTVTPHPIPADKEGQLLIQLFWKLAALAGGALCKCLMSKNACMLSGIERECVYKHPCSCNHLFLIRSLCRVLLHNMPLSFPPSSPHTT